MGYATVMRRRVVPEIMDAPGLPEADHLAALTGLRRIHYLSRTAQSMVRPLLAYATRTGRSRLTLLDVACGGGDVPVAMAHLARRYGIELQLTLIDQSPLALRQATMCAASVGGARTFCDRLPGSMPPERYDITTNSLFLHHLSLPQAVTVLHQMRTLARGLVIVSDLRRSRAGWALAWSACRLLTRSRIVHHDGPASVRAAWTMEEFAMMAEEAGMGEARISRCWPGRMLLVWQAAEERGV